MLELIILITGIAITLVLASMVLINNKRFATNRLFAGLLVALICWLVTTYISVNTSDNIQTLFWIRFIMFFVVLENTCFYFLTKVFPDRPLIFSKRLKYEFAYSIFVMIICLSPFLFIELAVDDNGLTSPVPGPGMALFLAHVLWFVAGGMVSIIKRLNNSKGVFRAQAKSLLLGASILYILIPLSNFILPVVFKISFLVILSPLYITLFAIIIGYSIIKQQLFDIKFAATRAVMYILLFSVVAALYFLAAFSISRLLSGAGATNFSRSYIEIALIILLAFLFNPLKNSLIRIANNTFLKDNYNSDDLFSRLSNIITTTTNLRDLLTQSANEITATLKIEQVFFLIQKQDNKITTVGTNSHKLLSRNDIKIIDDYNYCNKSSIIATLLNPDATNVDIVNLMNSKKIEIIIPLSISTQKIGYLLIGNKIFSKLNSRDICILESVANELTIAIQNILTIQEFKQLNETLQLRILNATKKLRSSNNALRHLDNAKDEFVGMVSHQLRTPLTSIKGYISMVLEGDVGKVSDMQKQLLNEAFISSERMVHLIGDFLNISRIQTGKFMIDKSPVDLSKVVEQEIDSIQSSAIARDLRYKYTKPKDFPILNVDEGKLRQVIMNFADNALYYSHENTVIEVDLVVEGKEIIYTVKDTGIGVPKAEQEHLFTKFFRASNAKVQRPDGTGVGLYLAKRIITGHRGKVVFESVENKGSTFGFRLPID